MQRQPWNATDAEVRAEAERIRPRLLEADRIDAPLLARQLEEMDDGDDVNPTDATESRDHGTSE